MALVSSWDPPVPLIFILVRRVLAFFGRETMAVVVAVVFVVLRDAVGCYYRSVRMGEVNRCELRFGVAVATALSSRHYFLASRRSMILCPFG